MRTTDVRAFAGPREVRCSVPFSEALRGPNYDDAQESFLGRSSGLTFVPSVTGACTLRIAPVELFDLVDTAPATRCSLASA